ncbi:dynamin family protein [Ideonella sp. 4Y16]|uniref:Dynamin family protein n=1 Tax=Ideonella alba TaxID=2824118 RepID=A0A940YG57_9BURK|nr:dynamin family protein [Ideonella alba]MBQ0933578.1 dynamin family protein [Ideonella alba]MBQ0946210.1 dynamin family protein [Ideonella alba]
MSNEDAIGADWAGYQQDTLSFLAVLGRLCSECRAVLYPDPSDAAHEKFLALTREAEGLRRQIQHLELRLVVVAPMKAGKSTIINAILGQDLLPNRNSAATSIPTEIVDEPECGHPILTLTQGLRERFRVAANAIRQFFISHDDVSIEKSLSQYPHLVPLAKTLRDDGPRPLKSEVHDKSDIQDVLMYLNDVTRICADVVPSSNPLALLEPEDTPRIAVQIRKVPGGVDSRGMGKLVIVDTPGPNEASQSEMGLERIVEHQLQESSVVLLVLDYTQLNTEAAAKIRAHVDRMRERVGDSNFIVAVNKVDARSKAGDMTQEQVRSYVSRELQIERFDPSRHLFEMSAVFGLEAASFLHAADSCLPDESTRVHAGALVRRKNPLIETEEELQEELNGMDEEQLKDLARRFWKKSRMEPFLEGSLSELMTRAGPKVFETAFHASGRILTDLKNALELRLSSSGTNAASIRREVEELQTQALKVIEARAEIDRRKDSAKKKLDTALQLLLDQVRLDVGQTIRRLATKDKADLAPTKDEGFIRRFLSGLLQSSRGPIQYERQSDADAAIERLLDDVKQYLTAHLNSARIEIKTLVREFVQEVRLIVEDELLPILKNSVDQMQKAFNARLEVPDVRFDVGEMEISFRAEKKSQLVRESGYDTETTYETRWYTLWLYDHKVERQVYRAAVYEDRYIIDLETLSRHAIASVGDHIAAVRQSLDAYLSENVARRIDRFTQRVSDDLDSYQANLEGALRQKELSVHEQELTRLHAAKLLDEIKDARQRGTKLSTYVPVDSLRR